MNNCVFKRIAAVLAALVLTFALFALPVSATEDNTLLISSYTDAAANAADEDVPLLVEEPSASDEVVTNLAVGELDEQTKQEIEESRKANIKDSLKIMGQGMLGIFVVMLLIYLVIVILNKVTAGKDGSDE